MFIKLNNKIEKEFEIIHSKLRQLKQTYNPSGENLHFYNLEKADVELYAKLLELAREGLDKVRKHSVYFSRHALYDDGMFWYELFLTIGAAALRIRADQNQQNISENVIRELTELLIDISEFTCVHPAQGGDIYKRSYEALGNMLYGFYNKDLVEFARKKSRESGFEKVSEFVELTIGKVEKMLIEE